MKTPLFIFEYISVASLEKFRRVQAACRFVRRQSFFYFELRNRNSIHCFRRVVDFSALTVFLNHQFDGFDKVAEIYGKS